jgi:hypothetical protein
MANTPGGTVFVSNLPAVSMAIANGTAQSVMKAAVHVSNKIKRNLTGKRTGKLYRKEGTKRRYRASAPGEFPAVKFGQLRGSVRWTSKGGTAYVHTDVNHGTYLEDPKHTRVSGARPFMKRTFEEEKSEVMGIIYGAGNPASRRWF